MAPRVTTYRTAMGTVKPMQWKSTNSNVVSKAVEIAPQFMQDIEHMIRGLEAAGKNVFPASEIMTRTLAGAHQGFAMEKSRGKYDPYQKVPEMAWMIPVRRIRQTYYRNWKVRRIGLGAYEMYNDSREAYFIEYGIHTSARRVRRPIMKLTLIKTLRWADSVGVGHRVWEQVFAPLRPTKEASQTRLFNLPMQRGSLLVGTNMQSPPQGMGSF